MALTTTVTKKSVSLSQPKMWMITLNMSLKDNAVEVLNKDYSIRYKTGDSISDKVAKFIELMQADINWYKSEQLIYNNIQLDTAVTNVQAGLVV